MAHHDSHVTEGSDAVLDAAIEDAISFADAVLPTDLEFTNDTVGDLFGCASLRRLMDLLEAELALARAGLDATSRLQGRGAIEAWLWAIYFFLEPDEAMDRLDRESRAHHRRRAIGMHRLWERVAAFSASDLPPPDPVPSREGTSEPNVKELAECVADARRRRRLPGGDKADGEYHNTYRWDSMFDVHPSFDMLIRYFEIDEDARMARVFPTAQPEPADALRGLGGALETARLLLDGLGVYCNTREINVPLDMYQRMVEIASMRGPADDSTNGRRT